MPEITFGESAIGHMLDVFDCKENEDGLLVDADGNLVVDAFDNPVEVDTIGGFIHIGDDYQVNSDGRVECRGELVTKQFGELPKDEGLVPVDEETAVLRDNFTHLVDYVDCERRIESD